MNWKEFQTSDPKEIFRWAETQPWAQSMSRCQQDSLWHAEGDVWTHTKLVCENLIDLPEFQSLCEHEKAIVFASALFHDVSKPETTATDPITGKTTSPKHAVKGEFLSRKILREMKCDFQTANHISFLVRHHGKPVFLHDKPCPENEVIRTSLFLNNKLLYLLAKADFLGRKSLSNDRNIDDLEYWVLLAAELACDSRPYPFPNPHARFLFGQRLNDNRFYQPHENYSCTVTMMVGLPGSGKDTWIQENRSDQPVVSLDQIRRNLGIEPTENQGRVAQAAKEQCKELLRTNTNFIFNATNTIAQTRQRWTSLFHNYHAMIEIVYLEPPLEKILKQNREREEVVPSAVIQKLADSLQPPTAAECHRLIQ